MEFSELKMYQRVYDRFSGRVSGRVVEILKTRVKVQFAHDIVTYDKPHVKCCLEIVERSGDHA